MSEASGYQSNEDLLHHYLQLHSSYEEEGPNDILAMSIAVSGSLRPLQSFGTLAARTLLSSGLNWFQQLQMT